MRSINRFTAMEDNTLNINKSPRILIIGQPFNTTEGGGVTIGNLFPVKLKKHLYFATVSHRMIKHDLTRCEQNYLIGKDEIKINPFFKSFIKVLPSGIVLSQFSANYKPYAVVKNSAVYILLDKIVTFLGLDFWFYRMKVSKNFIKWFREINPDIIYCQLGHYELNLFMLEMLKMEKKVFIVHIMDDWLTRGVTGIFKKYLQSRLINSFNNLLPYISSLFCISEPMASEFANRYKLQTHYFHNPVDIKKFVPYELHNIDPLKNESFIVYAGRIGNTNIKSIKNAILYIQKLFDAGFRINLLIYSVDINRIDKIKHPAIKLVGHIPHSSIPSVFNSADILLLPLDFDKISLEYTKLSMPTKATEYMASGAPILIFAPKENAVCKSAVKYQWGVTVTNDSCTEFTQTLLNLLSDNELRFRVSKNAVAFATSNFLLDNVQNNFWDTLINAINSSK